MRYVDRAQVRLPTVLQSTQVETLRRELLDYAADVDGRSAQRRASIDRSVLDNSDLALSLQQLFGGRCAYCETPIPESKFRALEAHRPLGFAESPDGKTDQAYYTWLAYDWDNMLWVCTACRRQKENRFYVRGQRGPLGASIGELRRREKAILLDPCFDEPTDDVAFLPDGQIRGLTNRGEGTIKILGLDRFDLVQSRANSFRETIARLAAGPTALRIVQTGARTTWARQIFEDVPHPGAVTLALLRAAATVGLQTHDLPSLLNHLANLAVQDRQSVLQSLSNVDFEPSSLLSSPLAAAGPPRTRTLEEMPAARSPIASVSIQNFKALKNITFDLPETLEGNPDAPPCMVILGENATGKSSVLEAITLALLGTREISELDRLIADEDIRPDALVHRPDIANWDVIATAPLSVTIDYLSNPYRTTLVADGRSLTFDGDEFVSRIVLAYGPRRYFTRRTQRRFRAPAYRVRSLFDPMATVPNPSHWLLTCSQADFDAAVRALREILMLRPADYFDRADGHVVVDTAAGRTRLEEMSVGYKSVIAMASDIMRELIVHYDNLEYASATVLIDEIETHLHPRWKMRIISALRRAFPRVQFIVTTHDPLCLRGMHDGEVFVLQRSEDTHTIEQLANLPSIQGMRAEQILTSEFFGLGSTDPETDAKLALYHHLATRADNLTEGEQQRMQQLRTELQQNMVVGDTLQDQAFVEALKQVEAETRVRPVSGRLPERTAIVDRALAALRRSHPGSTAAASDNSASSDDGDGASEVQE